MGSLFLVRHATTDASASGVNLGQRTDPPLSPDGFELAARTAVAIRRELEAMPAVELRLLHSPARRCRQTADAIAGELPSAGPAAVEPGLWEIDYGAWEGLTAAECEARDPELRARWEADPYATATPGGESGRDVAERAFGVLQPVERWLTERRDRGAIVVAHNHVVRLRLISLLGLPMADYRRRVQADPGSYSVVTFTPDHAVARRINVEPA